MSSTFALAPDLVDLAQRYRGVVPGPRVTSSMGRRDLTRAVAAGVLVPLWREMYVLAGREKDPDTLLFAADHVTGTQAIACLHTAAHLYGFDIAGDGRLHVLAHGEHHSEAAILQMHRLKLLDPIVLVGDRPATTGTETAVTIAARMPGENQALAVLDAAVRAGATTREQIGDYVEVSRIAGIRQVRQTFEFVDGRAESPRESWLRLACIRVGLPVPVPQHEVVTASGRRYRLDLAWPELKVACEYDGVEFHTGEQLTKDRDRLNDLSAEGWMTFSVTGQSFREGLPHILRLVEQELLRRGTALALG